MNNFEEEYEKINQQLINKLNRLNCDWEDRNLQDLLREYNKVKDSCRKNEDITRMNRMNILFKELSGSYVSLILIEKVKKMIEQ